MKVTYLAQYPSRSGQLIPRELLEDLEHFRFADNESERNTTFTFFCDGPSLKARYEDGHIRTIFNIWIRGTGDVLIA